MKESWSVQALGDVCQVVSGQSPEGRFYNAEGKGVPFHQGKTNFGTRFLQEPNKWTTQVTKLAEPGDIVMSVRAPVGPVNIASERVCIGRGLAAISPSTAIDRDFLFLQLQALEDRISGSEGAVFPSISRKQIEAIPLVVPPLAEQERIVRILDDALTRVDLTRRIERRKSEALEGLRASLLYQAFTGQL